MTIQGKGTVLIVDDEAMIRENLQRFFQSNGYDASVASNGEDAFILASRRVYEVALLDIRMPGMSGVDLLRRLRTDYPDIEAIMMTGVSDLTTAVECMRLGAYDYVLKPFTLDEMFTRVEKACERRFLALQVRDNQRNLETKLAEQAQQLHEMMTETVQRQREVHGLNRLLQGDILWVQEMRERLQILRRDMADTPGIASDPSIRASRYADLRARVADIADFADAPPA